MTEENEVRNTGTKNDSDRAGAAVEADLQAEQSKGGMDYFKLMFRSFLAAFCGFSISGLILGFIDGIETGINTEFGSPVSLGLSMALMIAFWMLFTVVGPFKNK